MVAAAIQHGMLPANEFGLRFLDALMGAIAFIYIYLFGIRLGSAVCGVAAVLATFALDTIVFEHGLRSNNMEAPLFLGYCGGVYHFMRWVDVDERNRLHAAAVCAFFTLAFMTKFVAALFLPLICAATILAVPVARERFIARWRDWLAPVSTSVVLIAPWFLYETAQFGREFWRVILGEHVYVRFTGSLDPTHLRPWHFYFTQAWTEMLYTGSRFVYAAAVVALLVKAWQGRPWQMRLLLIWWLLPFVLISMGSSKLFHYAYPFLPPIALSAGWLSDVAMRGARGASGQVVANKLERLQLSTRSRSAAAVRPILVTLAILAIVIAVATAVSGQLVWRVGDVKVLQNSSTVRPLLIGALLMTLSSRAAVSVQILMAMLLAVLLPVSTYAMKAARANSVDYRLRSLRYCAARVHETNPSAAAGVYNAARGHTNHSHYYYLYRLGPWIEPERADPEDIRRRFFQPDRQAPVLMTTSVYNAWRQQIGSASAGQTLPPAAVIGDIVVVTPGAYQTCAAAAIRSGAQSPDAVAAGTVP